MPTIAAQQQVTTSSQLNELPESTDEIQGCELPEQRIRNESLESTVEIQNCEQQGDGVPEQLNESLENTAEIHNCEQDCVQHEDVESVDVGACQ